MKIEILNENLNSKSKLARATALQSFAVNRSTGNDVVATISAVIFFLFFAKLSFNLQPS